MSDSEQPIITASDNEINKIIKNTPKIPKGRVICEVCNKELSKKTIRAHMKIHNTNNRFICDICDKPLTNKRTLKGHKDRMHPKV